MDYYCSFIVFYFITFVATIHTHLAPIWTDVAFHALYSCLAGTQTRHLLAVISDRARSITVTRCQKKRLWKNSQRDETISGGHSCNKREIRIAWFIFGTKNASGNLNI